VLAGNPFYLMSAALLLYGLYRLAMDPGFLPTEARQLFFSFGSLQGYEVLLVAVAVFLARRRIWYDATVLTVLENAFLLVPFILLSHAALIEQGWLWGFCSLAVGLALARMVTLRFGIRELNLPARVLGLGLLVLLVNAALAIIYRVFHETKLGKNTTEGAAYWMNEWTWWLILPAMMAGATLLPLSRRENQGEMWPRRAWLPALFFRLWIVAMMVHLYCLGYVYDFELRWGLVAPALWTLGWITIHRPPIWMSPTSRVWPGLLLATPFGCALLAALSHDGGVVFSLALLNTGLYVCHGWREPRRTLAFQLALGSTLTAALALPGDGFGAAFPDSISVHPVMLAILVYVVVVSLVSRDPRLGLAGSVAMGIGAGMLMPSAATGIHWGVQAAMVFLLLHSLAWDETRDPTTVLARRLAAGGWVIHSLAWMQHPVMMWEPFVPAGVALIGWCLVGWIRGNHPPFVVLIAAVLVGLSGSLSVGSRWMLTASAGPLAVAWSFVLLGLGTALALTKPRWHRRTAGDGNDLTGDV
jgi:hypothetical protein